MALFQKGFVRSSLGALQFSEDRHEYTMDNIRLPSVTQLMAPLYYHAYGKIDGKTLNKAAERGTAIHFAIEQYDGHGYIDLNSEFQEYFEAYLKFRKDHSDVPIANELRVFHRQLLYAGTIDKISVVDGKVTLLDIKNTAALDTNMVSVQVSAYREACKSHGLDVEQMAVLRLKKDATYDYVTLEDNFDIFISLMKIYSFERKEK